MKYVQLIIIGVLACSLGACCAPQADRYEVVRHDYVGSLSVYLAGESDGFVVYMPVPNDELADDLTCSAKDGLRIWHTAYKFDWNGPYFTGTPKPDQIEIPAGSATGVLARRDGQLYFTMRDLEFEGKQYAEIGPVEVTLDRKPRP